MNKYFSGIIVVSLVLICLFFLPRKNITSHSSPWTLEDETVVSEVLLEIPSGWSFKKVTFDTIQWSNNDRDLLWVITKTNTIEQKIDKLCIYHLNDEGYEELPVEGSISSFSFSPSGDKIVLGLFDHDNTEKERWIGEITFSGTGLELSALDMDYTQYLGNPKYFGDSDKVLFRSRDEGIGLYDKPQKSFSYFETGYDFADIIYPLGENIAYAAQDFFGERAYGIAYKPFSASRRNEPMDETMERPHYLQLSAGDSQSVFYILHHQEARDAGHLVLFDSIEKSKECIVELKSFFGDHGILSFSGNANNNVIAFSIRSVESSRTGTWLGFMNSKTFYKVSDFVSPSVSISNSGKYLVYIDEGQSVKLATVEGEGAKKNIDGKPL